MPTETRAACIIFADICRSTLLFETYGDARAKEIVGLCLAQLSRVTVRHGGRVIKTIGDEVMSLLPDAESAIACAEGMQRIVSDEPELKQLQIHIRVGLHFGEVLDDGSDIYGDAVNVAARLVELALRDQIITSVDTVKEAGTKEGPRIRSLGANRIRGKTEPLELFEVMWRPDQMDITTLSTVVKAEDLQRARLYLTIHGLEKILTDNSPPLTVGRDEQNDVSLEGNWVSRNHANIICRNGLFVLIDRSTNGSYVEIGENESYRVHRDEIHLHDAGVISFGRPVTKGNEDLILFRCSE